MDGIKQARQACRAILLLRHKDGAEVDRVMGLMEFECTFGSECWLEHYGVEPGAGYAGYLLRDFTLTKDRWPPGTQPPSADETHDIVVMPARLSGAPTQPCTAVHKAQWVR
jgi:hypothetical protein